ncbi:MAG: Gfo/Idh/MocA family oxidoreductase [Bacteroidetes bacterium]|nr:Gfo/Idh/MocA family oxidoreductase [Bacteroidota bacterium]
MYQALVIGCGSIGAQYDLENNQILTHAKAIMQHPEIALTVADKDLERAKQIGSHYNVPYLGAVSNREMEHFDLICLSVATPYHIEYLTQFRALNRPFLICEKPVVSKLSDLELVKSLRLDSNRILVNYIRRFQPGFLILQQILQNHLKKQGCTLQQVVVRYQRGLLNNGSHALDLLSYLLGSSIELQDIQIARVDPDAFEHDPTITLQAKFEQIPIHFLGFINSKFKVFEIDIYTSDMCISVGASGNTIQYYSANKHGILEELPAMRQMNVMDDYMVPVLAEAITCMKTGKNTNFAAALQVNEQILKIVDSLN